MPPVTPSHTPSPAQKPAEPVLPIHQHPPQSTQVQAPTPTPSHTFSKPPESPQSSQQHQHHSIPLQSLNQKDFKKVPDPKKVSELKDALASILSQQKPKTEPKITTPLQTNSVHPKTNEVPEDVLRNVLKVE